MATSKSNHQIHKEAVLLLNQKLRDENIITILASPQSKSDPDDDTPDLVVYGENKSRILIKAKVDSNKPSTWGTEGKLGYGYSWIVNKASSDQNFYYCLIRQEEGVAKSQYFVVPAPIVSKYMTESAKYQDKSVKLFVLATGDNPQSIHVNTPQADDYENRWGYLDLKR